MRYNDTVFPIQKLPASKKNKEWKEACVDYIIGSGETASNGMTISRFEEMQTYYDLYNSIYNEKDLRYVTNPFKVDDGFPATPQDFNIIRPKVNLLLGEETKRPFNIKVARTSQIAASDMQDKMKQMLLDYVMATIMSRLSPEDRVRYQQALDSGEIMPPEQIHEYLTRDYKDIAENAAYHTLKYLRNSLNLDHVFMKGWEDALIAGEEIYYIGIQNGEPYVERVNPLYFSYDMSPDLEFIEDADWCCYRMRLSYNDIYDKFYDKLDEKQLNELLAKVDNWYADYGIDKNMVDDFVHIKTNIVDNPSKDWDSDFSINVWHACWKKKKKIGFVTLLNDEGLPEEFIVDENYKVTGEEINVTWDWIIEVWEGYRAGDDLYFGIQPIEYQHISADNLNSQKLPYTGVVYSNNNSVPKSLVSIMKPLQYMYIIIWYRLELALARDKGKVVNMDVTQIPKSMGMGVEKWMHYLSSLGVNFINPYEEGWDIPGREGGKPATFNQITALDLTMSTVIGQYIDLMAKIEDMCNEISGVSKQRQGAISSNELVGNVQTSVVQSANITEPLFWLHNQCKKRVMTMLLNTAKAAWKDSNKTKLNYIFDDVTRAFITLTDDFFYEDMDIFITDSTKEAQNIEQLKSLTQPAMQNGATLLDIAEILTSDNMTVIKNKLSDIEAKRIEMQEQAAQAEQQRQIELIQQQAEAKQQEYDLKQQELNLQKYKIDEDNSTKIAVAEISAFGYADNANNDTSDEIALAADQAQRDKELSASIMDKQMQYAQKQNEIANKQATEKYKVDKQKEIEQEKLRLEREKLKAAKELQKQKDNAAMQREKLKASTALKNPVTGENKPNKK